MYFAAKCSVLGDRDSLLVHTTYFLSHCGNRSSGPRVRLEGLSSFGSVDGRGRGAGSLRAFAPSNLRGCAPAGGQAGRWQPRGGLRVLCGAALYPGDVRRVGLPQPSRSRVNGCTTRRDDFARAARRAVNPERLARRAARRRPSCGSGWRVEVTVGPYEYWLLAPNG